MHTSTMKSFSFLPRLSRSSISKFTVIPSYTCARTMAVITNPRDPNTLSNYNNWRSTHITANFDILFDQKKLVGNVIHQLKSTTDAESQEIIFDTSHLDIGGVKVDGQPSKWEWLSSLDPLGTPLKISLEKGVKLNATVEVEV